MLSLVTAFNTNQTRRGYSGISAQKYTTQKSSMKSSNFRKVGRGGRILGEFGNKLRGGGGES